MCTPIQESVHGFEMTRTLNDIGWYAKEHNLTPEQVRTFFEVGAVAARQLEVPKH
jgi:hypothetical protein